ncbi:MAG: TraR/DksA family transcriptional regulator [Stellaceae bacterium]
MIPKLHAALRRIEDETCGICADCGEEIDRRRLEQVPGALRCTGCQRRYETGIQPS